MVSKETIGMAISGLGVFDTLLLMDETFNNSGVCQGGRGQIFSTPIDCGYVLTSEYSKILGIPLAVIGFLFYGLVFFLFFINRESRPKILPALFVLSSVGFLASMAFVYIQFFVLGLVCLFCMASALTSTSLFVFMAIIFRSRMVQDNMGSGK